MRFPRCATINHFGLVQAVDRFSERIFVAVVPIAGRRPASSAQRARPYRIKCWPQRNFQNRRNIFSMIQPSNVFKDNLAQLPTIEGIERIDLVDGKGAVVASIENKPGKQGSVAVYHYLRQAFGALDVKAAEHGLAVYAEHTADARNRPGAHPNVDRLLAIVAGGEALRIDVVAAP
jgi:hypothetical protein